MSYHQDWLMRQIEAISATLAYILTGKKPKQVTVEENQKTLSDTNQLYRQLLALVAEGKICEAENLLFAAMEEANPEVPDAAVGFYTDINRLSDEELEARNFSREEIKEGLQAVCRHYGLDVF